MPKTASDRASNAAGQTKDRPKVRFILRPEPQKSSGKPAPIKRGWREPFPRPFHAGEPQVEPLFKGVAPARLPAQPPANRTLAVEIAKPNETRAAHRVWTLINSTRRN